MLDVPLAYGVIIEVSVTIASILHFIIKRTMLDRLHLIITFAGFFLILGFFEGNLFYAQAFFLSSGWRSAG